MQVTWKAWKRRTALRRISQLPNVARPMSAPSRLLRRRRPRSLGGGVVHQLAGQL